MARKFGKKMQEIYKSFDKNTLFTPADGVAKLSQFSKMRNFDESVDIDILFKKQKKVDLPSTYVFDVTYGIPKQMRILAVVSSSDGDKMRQNPEFSRISSFVTIGDISFVQKMISTREVKYDTVITTQGNLNVFRPLVKEVVELDQKLMPSKKNGTILDDNANIVSSIINLTSGTKITAKRQKQSVKAKIALVAFGNEKIVQNLEDVLSGLDLSLIKRVIISSSMGPGILVNVKASKKAV